MIVGIHKDPHKGFTRELERYETILDANAIPSLRLDADQADFWERAAHLDLFVFHWYGTSRQHALARSLLPIVEQQLHVPCFPNMATWWHYDDKIREYFLLRHHGFPVIPTRIFWSKSAALGWLEGPAAEFPLVFKLRGGASSQNVVLVRRKGYARKLVARMFGSGIAAGHVPGLASLRWKEMSPMQRARKYAGKVLRTLRGEEADPYGMLHQGYVLFQQFLPDNPFDTRVTVIGNRAFAYRRYVRPNDFRASGSGNADYDHRAIDLRCVRIALDVSRRLCFQSMCYDFLFDGDREPRISEMSYTYVDWMVWMCPGYWDDRMVWHEGHHWPQYCILADQLKTPGLCQPAMQR